MNENALKTATIAGERVIHGFTASKQAVAEALHDGQATVKHFIKRTRRTTEDLLDEAAHNIKRYPVGSVAIAFGVGTMVGVLVSRMARR